MQGGHTVGLYQQWCGATGMVDNCQVINYTLARPGCDGRNADQVTWSLGMQLYLPKK
jgi:SRSO17 transposase